MANILEYRCFAMVRNFVYLVIFLGILLKQRMPAFQLVTENDYVLVGHVFRQFYARDWFNCIQACQDEPRCISYNYERSAGANGLCELNNCGVEGLGDKDKSLFVSKGFVFQQIRQSKVSKCISKFGLQLNFVSWYNFCSSVCLVSSNFIYPRMSCIT